MLKSALNAVDDGHAGLQVPSVPLNGCANRELTHTFILNSQCLICLARVQELGGNATLIFYGTEEGNEGKTAYMERRRPNFSKFPRRP